MEITLLNVNKNDEFEQNWKVEIRGVDEGYNYYFKTKVKALEFIKDWKREQKKLNHTQIERSKK